MKCQTKENRRKRINDTLVKPVIKGFIFFFFLSFRSVTIFIILSHYYKTTVRVVSMKVPYPPGARSTVNVTRDESRKHLRGNLNFQFELSVECNKKKKIEK